MPTWTFFNPNKEKTGYSFLFLIGKTILFHWTFGSLQIDSDWKQTNKGNALQCNQHPTLKT